MTEQIQKYDALDETIIESLILRGDISGLTSKQKVEFYKVYCERIGLDPTAQPFKILKLQGKETLYLDRSGAQQLNKLHRVSHQITSREKADDLYIVTARASSGERFTESIGAVNIKGFIGDALANAMMKAETKAKRRATLDLLGLGILDETEVETIPKAEILNISGENITVAGHILDETIQEPIRELTEDFSKCNSLKGLKALLETLNDDERKEYYKLKEQTYQRIIEANIDDYINKLKSNNYESWINTIEPFIDKQEPERKQQLIDLYNARLEKIGVNYKYEELPFK